MRAKNRYLILAVCLAVVFCGLICCRLPEQPAPTEIPKAKPAEILQAKSTDPNIVKTACELISHGKFDAAGELILDARTRIGNQESRIETQLGQLAEIVGEYKSISEQRRSAREAAYAERLAELEKLRVATDTNDVNDNVNDVNNISKALSVIAKVSEFADEAQKAELLSEPFTQQTFQKAIDKASEFESKGEWLDAYAICYSWLQAIDEANEAYSDHAEQLIEKAKIAASFQDSPCESREERYEGVKKEMFERSIDALRFNYVSSIIDYRQMAIEAIKRCKLLGEVVNSLPIARRSLAESGVSSDESRFSAWSSGLAAILDEIREVADGSEQR